MQFSFEVPNILCTTVHTSFISSSFASAVRQWVLYWTALTLLLHVAHSTITSFSRSWIILDAGFICVHSSGVQGQHEPLRWIHSMEAQNTYKSVACELYWLSQCNEACVRHVWQYSSSYNEACVRHVGQYSSSTWTADSSYVMANVGWMYCIWWCNGHDVAMDMMWQWP